MIQISWEQGLQLSIVGGALVFAYIASTWSTESEIQKNFKTFFYLVAMGLVLASIGSNYSIIDATNSTLLQDVNGNSRALGRALNGVFISMIAIISSVLIIFLYLIVRNIIENYNLNKKNDREGER